MYNEFCITGVVIDLSNKQLTINTNFMLNPKSIDISKVVLSASNGAKVDYTVEADDKDIIITLVDLPSPNLKYHLHIEGIEDALDRKLKDPFDQTIEFQNIIKHKLHIISPHQGEAFNDNLISVNVKATPEDEPITGYYLFEISSDVAFYNIIHKIKTTDNSITVQLEDSGQYFVRCKLVNEYDQEGEWTNKVDFIIVNKSNNKNENEEDIESEDNKCIHEDDPFIDELLSIDKDIMDAIPPKIIHYPENGVTNQMIYVTFDKEIDPKSLPKKILVVRRDI